MKMYVVIAFGLLAAQHVIAQEEMKPASGNKYLQYKYGVKLYNDISYEEKNRQVGYRQTTQNRFQNTIRKSNFLRPTVAFQWRNKRNNFHEIELSRFNIEKDNSEDIIYQNGQSIVVNGSRIVNTNISIRYEYVLQFCKKKNRRLVPALGLGANPYYEKDNYNPKISSAFPAINLETGFRTYLIPRVTYYFSRKLYLDVNVPLCFSNFSLQYQKIGDPTLSIRQQRYGVINLEMFPKMLSARVGLGFKI